MLRKKFFHRARKIPVSEQELKARSKKKEKKKDKDDTTKREKSEAEEERKKDDGESSHAEEKKDKVKKEKRKIRLDMHLEQQFVDGNDAYVWIYDPIPYYYWLAGSGVVLAVVALCLFPLWPPVVRYYNKRSFFEVVLKISNTFMQERCLLSEYWCRGLSYVHLRIGCTPCSCFLSVVASFDGSSSSMDIPKSYRRRWIFCLILATLEG